jgi:hypothetical protein
MTDSLQDSRRLWADLGNQLSYERQLDNALQSVFSNQKNFYIFIDFLRGNIPIEDIRLNKDLLRPDALCGRIAQHISEDHIDRWTKCSVSAATFQLAFDVMMKCVSGGKLAVSLIRTQLTYAFFRAGLANVKESRVDWLLGILAGSQDSPEVAAEIVYDFIRAVRDSGKDRSVLTAFFEGFSLEAGAQTVAGFKFAAKWNSAPMLQALVRANDEELAHLHEDFIRKYLAINSSSTDASVGQWQQQYDQRFQMLINLQSGMFHLGATYGYGKS